MTNCIENLCKISEKVLKDTSLTGKLTEVNIERGDKTRFSQLNVSWKLPILLFLFLCKFWIFLQKKLDNFT